LSGGISATADYNKGERGDRKRQHSIRIHDSWRLCFVWLQGNVYDMVIVDYRREQSRWLNLQSAYDLEIAQGKFSRVIEREVRPAVLADANAAS
jgi:hypothetical protein